MRENVEFLRQGYEALQRGDLETFKALARERLDPDFEFHLVWDGRVLRGYEGTLEWLSDTRDTWRDYSQEVDEIIDLGQDVVVVLRISARGSGSGVPVEQEFAVSGPSRASGRCPRARSVPPPTRWRAPGLRTRRSRRSSARARDAPCGAGWE